eukprot:Protomagalhaensia_sp_Gyna_25__5511@NODE_739_length_2717_cov_42_019417_g578_i0_p1_GENE_NODE_739_length_2717_cov_42_019417_g578_i0NODE_739_length_2717_cov_42_019417_g578_i0_p1_ORF_typecomplete_len349_score57_28DUF818/PF05677_12/3e28Hydrolase_4/PF12146_8/1_3e27Peptidase_S9/PF00326_21/1_6e19Abhydrolase_1/PF00561_20/3_2e16DUF1057/PF06342_12/2_3e12Abhydrolase_6/PF12697_7/8_6e13Abhydrolase_2/PF02230_16/2_1e12DLH/PF01738_18/2e12Abhydrolase_3/PF07859_13/2_4e12Peptidase_S15/PF02129_18/7e11Abhydrolase_5/PF
MLLVKVLITAFTLLVAVCGLLYLFQDRLLFFPKTPAGYDNPSHNPSGLKHPGEYRIPYRDLSITNKEDGIVLHAWFMKQGESESRPTVIFFQGNAGNMGFRLPNLVDLYRSLNCSIVAPSYRGYGWSTGHPTELGLKSDVKAVLEYVIENSKELDVDPNQLFIFGRSLGGAMAIYLAHEFPNQVKAVMLENTFLSIKEMAKHLIPPLGRLDWLVRLLARINFNSNELVKSLKMPMLFISGEDDTLVPPTHMERLFELAQSTRFKWMARVAGGTHNDTWQTCPKEYYSSLRAFVDAVLQDRQEGDTEPSVKELRLGCVTTATTETPASLAGVKLRGPKFYEVMPRQVAQ